MGKKGKKGKKGELGGDYVTGLPLFAQASVIPAQDLFSDVIYAYDYEKLEEAWAKGSTSGIKDFFTPFKRSPYGFVQTLPAWYGENLNQVQIQEFEFSKNALVRTMYSEDFDGLREDGVELGSLWFASRDVVTGNFKIKNGKLRGTAFALTRQYFDDGSPGSTRTVKKPSGEIISQEFIYPSKDVQQWVLSEGVALSSFGNAGLNVLYPYNGAWESIEPVTLTDRNASISGISVNKLFPEGWQRNPFGNDLI